MKLFLCLIFIFFGILGMPAMAQEASSSSSMDTQIPLLSVNFGNSTNADDLVPMLRVVGILTILTLSPAILLLTSAFVRILMALTFLRQAIGTPTMPPNQVLIGLTLFLTYFVMAPYLTKMYDTALHPYMEKQMSSEEAVAKMQIPLREFMLGQVREKDLLLFYDISKEPSPENVSDIPMKILVPAFVISELKAGFEIGFMIYLPFIVIDMIVSSVLMAMGMMMLPPTVVSLPVKVILFVLVDGWNLLIGALLRSF